jgi:TRAP-type C4-dicarboxylate transport system permease small subunit
MLRITSISDVVAAVSLAAMTAITALDVLLRYAFNMPIAASIELVETALVGAVLMALPSASVRGVHISIDYIDMLLSERARRLLDRASDLVISAFLAGLTILLVRRGTTLIERGDLSMTLRYPTGYLAYFMATATALTALVHLVRFSFPAALKG